MKKILAILSLVILISTHRDPNAQTLQFYQDNLIFSDRDMHPDTSLNSFMGRVKLSFTGTDTIKYFNLSVSGNGIQNTWPIRNFRINSLDSVGTAEDKYFSFIIADTNSSGVNITSVNYGFSMTTDTVALAPVIGNVATVGNFKVVLYNGIIDNRPIANIFAKNILNDAVINSTGGKTLPPYIIQDCGKGEGLPEALSDGLQYLDRIPVILGWDPVEISIEAMKEDSRTKQEGAYLYHNGLALNSIMNTEFENSGLDGSFMSAIFPPPTITDLDDFWIPLMDPAPPVYASIICFILRYEFENPLTHELTTTDHVVVIREITKISDEEYLISFSHDITQGEIGGTIVEEAYYYPSTAELKLAYLNGNNEATPISITDVGAYYLTKSDPPLPVELASFAAHVKESSVELIWITSSEINNYGFDIERKLSESKESEWSKAGFQIGRGSVGSNTEYSFIDKNLNSGKYNYRLKQINYDGSINYFRLESEVVIGIPRDYFVSQNFPNPFNPSTKINYELPFDGNVTIKLFDISGREVSTLKNNFEKSGYHSAELNLKDFSSGTYYYEFRSGNFRTSGKLLLIK